MSNENEGIDYNLDSEEVRAVIAKAEAKIKQTEEGRLKQLDEQEAEELKSVPRGSAGLMKRSNINAKYQVLRYGPRTNGSLEWLNAQRENNRLQIPETESQIELLQAYRQAIAPWRGNVRRISDIQAQFRAKGLKV